MENLKAIGNPSTFSCPDCGGVLFDISGQHPERYRCHTGHAFTLRSLACTQEELTDAALWTGLRALQEKESILRWLAQVHRPGTPEYSPDPLREADELAEVCAMLRKLTNRVPVAKKLDAVS